MSTGVSTLSADGPDHMREVDYPPRLYTDISGGDNKVLPWQAADKNSLPYSFAVHAYISRDGQDP